MLLRLDGTEGRNPFDPRDGPEAVAGRLAPLVDKGLRISATAGRNSGTAVALRDLVGLVLLGECFRVCGWGGSAAGSCARAVCRRWR